MEESQKMHEESDYGDPPQYEYSSIPMSLASASLPQHQVAVETDSDYMPLVDYKSFLSQTALALFTTVCCCWILGLMAMLLAGNSTRKPCCRKEITRCSVFLPTRNDPSIVIYLFIYIRCLKADVNVKLYK